MWIYGSADVVLSVKQDGQSILSNLAGHLKYASWFDNGYRFVTSNEKPNDMDIELLYNSINVEWQTKQQQTQNIHGIYHLLLMHVAHAGSMFPFLFRRGELVICTPK